MVGYNLKKTCKTSPDLIFFGRQRYLILPAGPAGAPPMHMPSAWAGGTSFMKIIIVVVMSIIFVATITNASLVTCYLGQGDEAPICERGDDEPFLAADELVLVDKRHICDADHRPLLVRFEVKS